MLRALPLGVAVLDQGGRLVLANDALRLLGAVPEPGAPAFLSWPDLATLERAFRDAMSNHLPLEETRELVSTSGRDVRVQLLSLELGGVRYGLLLADDNGRVKQTERALATALGQAEQHALRDPLTDLFNRRHLESILPAELSRADRLGICVSLLAIDADHFKKINDRFGHPAGDAVLVRLARVMTKVFRQGDTCARIGGEEFCAVLPRADVPQALQAAERLHRIVRALRFEGEPDLRVAVSIGVATAQPPGERADWAEQGRTLMARADAALYRAKQNGRNRTEAD